MKVLKILLQTELPDDCALDCSYAGLADRLAEYGQACLDAYSSGAPATVSATLEEAPNLGPLARDRDHTAIFNAPAKGLYHN